MHRIESLLSARLFISPQIVGERIYFMSNLSGHLSLYGMYYGGSVPEPLLPPHIAMHNQMLGGYPFYVFPLLDSILVMLDHDGDEVYQPMLIPIEGGYPEPLFVEAFKGMRMHLVDCDIEKNMVYFNAEGLERSINIGYRAVVRSASEQFEQMTPYVLANIELDEGPKTTGQVVCTPEEAWIGMRVRPVFRRIGATAKAVSSTMAPSMHRKTELFFRIIVRRS